MPFRFQCDKCQGTFDAALQTSPPSCLYPGARKGTVSLMRKGLFGGYQPIDPVGNATGCQDGPRALSKEQFRQAKLQIPHFVPFTFYGNFNCEYKPTAGLLLITLDVYLDYKLDAGKAGEVLPAWTAEEKLEFQDDCQRAVRTIWQDTQGQRTGILPLAPV